MRSECTTRAWSKTCSGVKIADTPPPEPIPAQPYEEYFSEGGLYRHFGKGSRIREKMTAEERAIFARERVRG